MNNSDLNILDEIISLDGDCLSPQRCEICPLRKQCLPVFLRKRRPSKKKRAQAALEAAINHCLMEESDLPSFKEV